MKKVVVLTGAGMSAESGLSTFRDSGGLWDRYPVEDVATPEGYARNPELVTRFYNERRRQLQEVEPCRGHVLLAAMEQDYDVTVITQNVDNLHERAGSTKVIHLHGELTKVTSSLEPDNPKYIRELRPEEWEVKIGDRAADGSQLRPFIVWFGGTDDRDSHRRHLDGRYFCSYRHFPECLPGGRAAELCPVPCSHLCDRPQARGRNPWWGTCASFDERSFRRGGRAYGLFGEIVAVPLLFRPSCLRFCERGRRGRGTSFPPPGILGKHASSFRTHRNVLVFNEL